MKKIARPMPEDAPHWCPYYWGLVKEDNLLVAFQNNLDFVLNLMATIPHSKQDHAYAPGKWTVKDIFIHLIDTERYYTYRAFSISRKVDIQLDFSISRDAYAANANAESRGLLDIAEEWEAIRNCSMLLFENLSNEMLDFKFSDKPAYTARSLGWMTVGHTIHHCNVLEEKYLNG